MIQIGTYVHGGGNIEEKIIAIKNAGFDSVDYGLGAMEQQDAILNDTAKYREEAERIRALADEVGLPITQTHAPFSYQNWKDPVVYEEFIAFCADDRWPLQVQFLP